MSGGSLDYLYNKEPGDLFYQIEGMEKVEQKLLRDGYTDIARDVRRLIEYVLTAENRISVLSERLRDVFHAVEWYLSGDYGESSLREHLEQYRQEAKQ